MDRTILNIASLLIGGAGIFAALTEYSVPELTGTYWNGNPFAKKAAVIKTTMTWIFTVLAVVGLLIQALAEIAGDGLPERQHGTRFYGAFFVVGLLAVVVIVWGLAHVGRHWARRRWLPIVVRSQRELFTNVQTIVRNQGWRDDQLVTKESVGNPQELIEANLKAAARGATQIEKLLDLRPLTTADVAKRVARLDPFFQGQPSC